jgi:hypothetical protein
MDEVPYMEMKIKRMRRMTGRELGSNQISMRAWTWGDFWGQHFVTETLRQAPMNTALGAEARVALEEFMEGEKSIQEIIRDSTRLRAHILQIGEQELKENGSSRFLNGVHPDMVMKQSWYKANGLYYGKMIGDF